MLSEKQFKDIPPLTLYYSTIILIASIISKFDGENIYLNKFKIDYTKIIKNHEIWRLFTTYFYIGKISFKFFFKFLLYFKRMKSNENKYKKKKNLAEFIMMLIYLMIIIHICNFIGNYYFKIKIDSFLSHQLMFSLILINSKREPNKTFRFYFFPIENKNVLYFLFSVRMAKNSDKVLNHIISFIPGLAFFWLKDVGPRLGLINNILITPKFLVDLLDENNKTKRKNNKKDNINKFKNNDDINNNYDNNNSNNNNENN